MITAVGLVGLGKLGLPMAELSAGERAFFRRQAHDISAERVEEARHSGGHRLRSPHVGRNGAICVIVVVRVRHDGDAVL